MKNVRDRQGRARHLWAAAKSPGEFGAPNTTAPMADAQVVVLICGHLDDRQPLGRQSGVRSQKGSPRGFTVKWITGNQSAGNTAGMAVAARTCTAPLAGRRPPVRLAAGGH